ncbi:MAG: hypothetical protein ACT4ON_14800 [Bacteroidota bacterium]
MKYAIIFFLFIIPFSVKAQDEIKADSGEYKKFFFVFTGSYLYNIYQGTKIFESFPGVTPNSAYPNTYIQHEYVNTSGFYLNGAYRHFFTKNISIQNGIRLNYKTEKSIHHDSLKNENNSPLKTGKTSMYILDYSFYFNYHFKRLTFSSGMAFPLVMYSYYSDIYEDKSVKKHNYRFRFINPLDFYISENIQYQPFKKVNLAVNLGIDISPELIFRKYARGYLIALNAGAIWLFERKNKPKKPEDYVK